MADARLAHTSKAIDIVAKTDIGIARILVVPIPGSTALGAESPGAAPNHLGLARGWAPGVFQGSLHIIIHFVKVVAPLPDIAADIKQSPGIGLFLPDEARVASGVSIEPSVVAKFGGVLAEEVGCFRAGAAGVFPFGFGGEAIAGGGEVSLEGG